MRSKNNKVIELLKKAQPGIFEIWHFFFSNRKSKIAKNCETNFKTLRRSNSIVIELLKFYHEYYEQYFNYKEWEIYAPDDIPRQRDGFNCGPFVCLYMECLIKRSDFSLKYSEKMNDYRGHIKIFLLSTSFASHCNKGFFCSVLFYSIPTSRTSKKPTAEYGMHRIRKYYTATQILPKSGVLGSFFVE